MQTTPIAMNSTFQSHTVTSAVELNQNSATFNGQRMLAILVWVIACTIASLSIAQPPPPPVSPVRPKPAAKPTAVVPPPVTTPVPKPKAVPPAAPAKPAAKGGKDKAKMEMTNPELITKDGIKLRAFYFASNRGKEAVPVIICHEWQGQASPYGALVKSLWDAGCAVIVPEFRGHGGSREYEIGGQKKEFDVARMSRNDVAKIVSGDMEAVKKFLREENNAEKLNLNALVLVGIREGAVIASQWAVKDLNFPSVGAMKQGQDVKALALVSPSKILKGVSLDETLQDRLLWQLPFLVVVGQSSGEFEDADRFYKRLESMKKRAGRGTADGLKFESIPTSLSGPALVNEAPGVVEKITGFIKTELIDKSSKIPWVKRE